MSDEDLIDESLYLIANPMKKKKTYVYENFEQDIQILLQKKYIIVGHNDLNKTLDIIELVDKKINISNFNDSISK